MKKDFTVFEYLQHAVAELLEFKERVENGRSKTDLARVTKIKAAQAAFLLVLV